ncbi:type I toxin-antitoxin system SymE family toxin [Salmonella enterica]|nr:type I toxin-antitoxin system SymE family toxin [Salmonella enterica]EBI9233728.1 type I toxin-antitoxin system SymE family toxin [Salmonella enterica]EDJ4635663.1 toxin SymE, type I toxin-antitoxin system family protein [Salmonella enterica]EEF4971033.1 type I addiction module toxin, SymE family [Salmonella enterica]EFR5816348.1 type I toxin-antitoxin system SymE family toxin [Salmonella enterica]
MIKISLCRDLSREPQTKISTCYSQSPSLHLKGDWLKEAGFDTGRGVTVRITEGGLTIIADNNEVQELREELYKVKQVVKGMRDGVFSVLNDSK